MAASVNDTIQCAVYLADLLQFGDDLTPFQFKLMAKALNWEWVNGRAPDHQRLAALCNPRNQHERGQLDDLSDFYDGHILTLRMREQRASKLAQKQNYSEGQRRRWYGDVRDDQGSPLGNGLPMRLPNGLVTDLNSNEINKPDSKSEIKLPPSSSSTSLEKERGDTRARAHDDGDGELSEVEQALSHIIGWGMAPAKSNVDDLRQTAQRLASLHVEYGEVYRPTPERIARFPDYTRDLGFSRWGLRAVRDHWKRFCDWLANPQPKEQQNADRTYKTAGERSTQRLAERDYDALANLL